MNLVTGRSIQVGERELAPVVRVTSHVQSHWSGRYPPLRPRPIMYRAASSRSGISSRMSSTAIRAVAATVIRKLTYPSNSIRASHRVSIGVPARTASHAIAPGV